VSLVALLRSPVGAADGFPSGAAIFNARCASCHGSGGMADGPLAPSLNPHPANLTTITRRNGGTFPAARVVEIINYGGNIVAHGTGPMPVWGKIFSTEGGRGKIGASTSRRNLIALKRYLESIQK
jgi:mono/diheme cytochrome c family protein